jgi:hemoglobin
MMTDTMTESLFDRIGGRAAVNAAVDLFYGKVLADERINHFFKNTDMNKQARHQKMFLTYAFGGAPNYPGKSMREAHKHLVLKEEHFAAVAENLEDTLAELGVGKALIGEVMALVATTHDDVLNL